MHYMSGDRFAHQYNFPLVIVAQIEINDNFDCEEEKAEVIQDYVHQRITFQHHAEADSDRVHDEVQEQNCEYDDLEDYDRLVGGLEDWDIEFEACAPDVDGVRAHSVLHITVVAIQLSICLVHDDFVVLAGEELVSPRGNFLDQKLHELLCVLHPVEEGAGYATLFGLGVTECLHRFEGYIAEVIRGS